ncbi:MAG TPA: hypothetical protein VK663_07490 [Burkholderiales bacterium]|nr:hypothetical protein [Burkholderiales bacterium]
MLRNFVLACVLFPALLSAAAPAHAVVERDCIVALEAKSGWSKDRKSTVYFMTGLELARITRVLPIEFHQVYAVISYDSGLPTVTRLDAVLLGVGREFTDADFVRLFANDYERAATQLHGEGRDLKWRLRARTPYRWVDAGMPLLSGVNR